MPALVTLEHDPALEANTAPDEVGLHSTITFRHSRQGATPWVESFHLTSVSRNFAKIQDFLSEPGEIAGA
jgi:hypothetical protein